MVRPRFKSKPEVLRSIIIISSVSSFSLSLLSLYFPLSYILSYWFALLPLSLSLFFPYLIFPLSSYLTVSYFLISTVSIFSLSLLQYTVSWLLSSRLHLLSFFPTVRIILLFFLLCFPIFSSFIYCNVISYFFSFSSRFSHIFSIYGVSPFVSSRWFLTKLSSGGYGNSKPGSCPPTYGREVVLSLVTYVVTLVW